jgi:SAM-dependent methyltransferase
VSWPWIFTAVLIVLNGIRLRRRAAALPLLHPAHTPAGEPVPPGYRLVAATGVAVDEATRRDATAYAADHGLDVLDLVPADLPIERCLSTLRLVDPSTYRRDRLIEGRGANQAVLVSEELLERAGIVAGDELAPADMLRLSERLKFYACTSADLVVAPDLYASPNEPERMLAWWRALFSQFTPMVLAANLCQWLFLAAGPLVAGRWGVVALVAFSLQPYLIFVGTALRPRDLLWQPPLRIVYVLVSWLRTVVGGYALGGEDDPVEAARPEYERLLADGTERFFEPRRSDCPLCGFGALQPWLVTNDLLQYKPGRFYLDRCCACGHIFQNPRLSLDGLDFYYKDFYDGLGDAGTNAIFRAEKKHYTLRAEMLVGKAEPESWLDVGAGHGHFCCMAREVWPATRFDGLDISVSIDEAERRGWVQTGYRGLFVERAADLEAAYDVVSMSHYLEHTREPLEEIAAAARVVKPDGYLLIEVPDPDSFLGNVLGRHWLPWFQPQHQHFLSLVNLERALADNGFSTVSVERAESHHAVDLSFAALSFVQAMVPPPRQPWIPAKGVWRRRLVRFSVFALVWPLLGAALLADQLLGAIVAHGRAPSNAYRVLARRDTAVSREQPLAAAGAS